MSSRSVDVLLATSIALAALTAAAGDSWRVITTKTAPALASNEIQFLQVLGDDLWIGTLSGLTRYRDKTFAVVTQVVQEKRRNAQTGAWETVDKAAKADLRVCTVVQAGADSLLVGAAGGLYKLQKLRLGDAKLKGRTVAPVVRYAKGTLWALAKNDRTGRSTLYENATGAWKPVKPFAAQSVVDCHSTRDGRLWVVVDGDGVFEVDPKQGVAEAKHHLAGMNVRSLRLDSRGRLWCGLLGRGVAVLNQAGKWIMHIEKETSAVLTLAEDSVGHIWAGTSSGGLYQYDGKTWTKHFADEGAVSLLFADSKGRLWVSTQAKGGLRCRENGVWRRSLDNRLPMTGMAEYKGTLWAGGVLDGIHVLERP